MNEFHTDIVPQNIGCQVENVQEMNLVLKVTVGNIDFDDGSLRLKMWTL